MKVIFHNDDFGLTYSQNQGISRSILNGVTRSLSIRTNGCAYEHAIHLIKNKLKNTSVGVHLNLTDGKTKTQYLANKDGEYKYNYLSYTILLNFGNHKLLKAIEEDLEGQIKKVIKSKIKISHLDGQDHIQTIPQIFEIVCKLCQKHKIIKVRLVREPFHLSGNISSNLKMLTGGGIAKMLLLNSFSYRNLATLQKYKLTTTDATFGVLYTNYMSLNAIIGALKCALKRKYKLIEIFSHPSYPFDKRDKIYPSKFMKTYANLANRLAEAETLQDEKLKKFLKENRINTISYNQI